MDLFVINRFWGEGNNELDQNIEEKDQINNLLSRIEERKKQKLHKIASASIVSDLSAEKNATETQSFVKVKRKTPKITKILDVAEDTHFEISEVESVDNSKTDIVLSQDIPNDVPILQDSFSKGSESTMNFTVIGSEAVQNKLKASHKLPSWLENPVVIPLDLNTKEIPLKDHRLPLDQRLMQRLKDNGITHFFPVQEKVLPWLLKNNLRCLYYWPRDICVSAPTGSGKTLAFVLPIIQALIGRIVPAIRVLVVLPVAELANQVGAVFRQYCSGMGLMVTVAVGGGTSLVKEHSLLVTANELIGCQTDILVTTPGRLVAHLRANSGCSAVKMSSDSVVGSISLGHLRFLVVDEADRVAEGSQNDWLSHLMHHLECQVGLDASLLPPSVSTIRRFQGNPHRPPQKLLFSATLSQDPEKLCALSLFQPKLFSTATHRKENVSGEEVRKGSAMSYVTPKELSEEFVLAKGGESEKPLVLLWLLQQRLQGGKNVNKALVFAGSRMSSARLALLLSLVPWSDSPVTSSHLSADLSLRDREKVMQDFVGGCTNILVCSDALARGVDIPQVDLVVSYDPPRHLKNHIHRIGRTGRAGRSGCAVTILTPNQMSSFSLMISGGSSMGHATEITLGSDSLSSLSERYKKALALMETTLMEERKKLALVSKKRKRKDGKPLTAAH